MIRHHFTLLLILLFSHAPFIISSSAGSTHNSNNNNNNFNATLYNDNVASYSVKTIIGYPLGYYSSLPSGYLATYYWGLSISSIVTSVDDDGKAFNDEIYFASGNLIYKYSKRMDRIEKLELRHETGGDAWYKIDSIFVVKKPVEEGNLIYFISESTVFMANESSGIGKRIAGEISSAGYNGDGQLAINSLLSRPESLFVKNGEVFISDTGNRLIRRIDNDGYLWNVFPKSFIKGDYPKQIHVLENNDILVTVGYSILKIYQNQTIETMFQYLFSSSHFTIFENDIYLISNYYDIVKVEGQFKSEPVLKLEKNKLYPGSFLIDAEGNYLVVFNGGIVKQFNRHNDTIGRLIIGCSKFDLQYYSLPANISQLGFVDSMTLYDNSIIFTEHLSSFVRQYSPDKTFMQIYSRGMGQISFISSFGENMYAIVNNNIYLKRNNIGNFTQLSGLLSPVNVPDNIKATQSTLNDPKGIFLKNRKLYIADSKNSRIRVIDLMTGLIFTIAGNGVSTFNGDGIATEVSLNSPSDLYVSDSNIVYVSDSGNHRIRAIFLNNGTMKTIAGNGIAGFSGDNYLAINASLNNPYGIIESTNNNEIIFCDTNNQRIRIINNGIISTLIGDGTKGFRDGLLWESSFNNPSQLFYSQGKIFISDTDGSRIRLANLNSKIVTTIAGTGEKGWNGDNFPTNSQLNNPLAVFYVNNTLYFSDTDNKKIRSLKMNLLSTLDIQFERPKGIAGDENFLYVIDGNFVKKFDPHNPSSIEIIGGGIGDNNYLEYAILNAENLAFDDEENVYFVDSEHNIIRKFDKDRIVSTVAGTLNMFGYGGDEQLATRAVLNFPKGIAVAKSHLFICDHNNQRIRKVNLKTGIISTIAGTGEKGYGGDSGLAIYAKMTDPSHLSVNNEGEVFFSDNNYVRKITRNGKIFRISGAMGGSGYNGDSHPALETSFSTTKSLIFDKDGSIIVFDANNEIIRKLIPHCDEGYSLEPETNTTCIPNCFGIYGKDEGACSSNGYCSGFNKCDCFSGFTGSNCSESVCFSKSGAAACNGKGVCILPNICQCHTGFSGVDCSIQKHMLILTGALLSCLLIVIFICIIGGSLIYVYIQNQRKKNMILKTDKLLDKRMLLEDFGSMSSGRELNIQNDMQFIIPLEQIDMEHPIKRIGEGSYGRVFSTKWENKLVAVKVMDMNDFDMTEETFIQEFQILSRLRHPNIVSFYGVSFSPTKRYIIMELCEKNLETVIFELQNQTITMSLLEKIEILLDIIGGINYLHNLNPKCIHRDLKPLNILVSYQQEYKLCDFGVGKILNAQTVNTMTNNVGSCYYIPPETTGCDNLEEFESAICATSIDIFSFAIIFWQLLFEVKEPYVSCHPTVLKKLKMSQPLQLTNMYHLYRLVIEKNLRPTIPFSSSKECQTWCMDYLSQSDSKYHQIFYEMCQLVKLCWDKKPNKRPNARTITEQLEGWKQELDAKY